MFEHVLRCRSCEHPLPLPFLSFGDTPLADQLVSKDQWHQTDLTAPLEVSYCSVCHLVQLTHVVKPEILYSEKYAYRTSVSSSLITHFRESAQRLIESRELDSNSLVVEIASNDGCMLENFRQHGIPVLGIDPAVQPTTAATTAGIPTLREFFTEALAATLAEEGKQADLILANNVLAHVPDLNGFIRGIRRLLKPDGLAVFEVPYLADLLNKCEFDTIYHQHLCYFSVTALVNLFRRHNLFVNRIERIDVQGGSLRLYVASQGNNSQDADRLTEEETRGGLLQSSCYDRFANYVAGLGQALHDFVSNLISQGKTLAAYGAAAKGTTLLHCARLGQQQIQYVVDKNPSKQGKFMPGNRLPIVSPDALKSSPPEYLLILPWNLANEIIAQQASFRAAGGKFLIPIPEPTVIE